MLGTPHPLGIAQTLPKWADRKQALAVSRDGQAFSVSRRHDLRSPATCNSKIGWQIVSNLRVLLDSEAARPFYWVYPLRAVLTAPC